MARGESYTWRVFIDERIREIALEYERSAWSGVTFRLLVDGNETMSGAPNAFIGIKFKIGKHRCKVRLAGWTQKPQQLLIDDRDASDYEPPITDREPRRENSERSGTPVLERERIVERQVVVVRCRFCGTLSPADLSRCQHCGSQKFS